MGFFVTFLKVKRWRPGVRDALRRNATYCRVFDIWIFEGDFQSVIDPEDVEDLGEGIVGPLGGLYGEKLAEIVQAACPRKLERAKA